MKQSMKRCKENRAFILEENNDLVQNMSNQHNLIHQNIEEEYSKVFCGDISMQASSSLSNIDRRFILNDISYNKNSSIYRDKLTPIYEQNQQNANKIYNYIERNSINNQQQFQDFQKASRSLDISIKRQNSHYQAKSDFVNQSQEQNKEDGLLYSKSLSDKYINKLDYRNKRTRYKKLISYLTNKRNGDSQNQKQTAKIQENNLQNVNTHKQTSNENNILETLEEDENSKRESDNQILSKSNIFNISQKSLYTKSLDNVNRKLGNFEKGIQIIQNTLKKQQNRSMRIISKIRWFINQLSTHIKNRRIQSLNQKECDLIGDVSSYQQQNNPLQNKKLYIIQNSTVLKQSLKEKISLQIKNYLFSHFAAIIKNYQFNINLPLLNPTNLFLVSWDTLQLLITYIFLYIYSIHTFFGQLNKDYIIGVQFYIIFFLVVIDILVQFNTTFYEKDTIINKRSKIIEKNIFSAQFWIDILVLVVIMFKLKYQSIDGLVYNPHHDIKIYLLNSTVFLLSNRNSVKKKRLDDIITLGESSKHIYKLFCQLVNVILVAHIVAICMYLLSLIEEMNNRTDTWIMQAKIQDYQYYEKYIYSLYWSITTMTTVGYGDISINNSNEAVFISIVMIIFSCVFAYSISNIGFILQEIEKNSKQLKDRLTIIQKYMNRKNVNSSLKSRVRFYLNFLTQEQKNRNKSEEDKILSLLSNKLRDEIIEEINTRIINKFTLFSANFSYQVMKEIVFLMEEILVSPNEIIFQENDIDDQSIYFIQSGIVEIYLVLAQLTQDTIFGEISFFSGLARKASARSLNLSTIYKINRQKLINLLQNYEEDFERFKMIQELIIFQQNYKCLYIQCYSCKQLGHLASYCPRTHICIDRQLISLKHNYSTFQSRNEVQLKRKNRIRLNPQEFVNTNVSRCYVLKRNNKHFNNQTEQLYESAYTDEEVNIQTDQQSQDSSLLDRSISECHLAKLQSQNNSVTKSQVIPQQQSDQVSRQNNNENHTMSSNMQRLSNEQDPQYRSLSQNATTKLNKDDKDIMQTSNNSPLFKRKDEDVLKITQNESVVIRSLNLDGTQNQSEEYEYQSPTLFNEIKTPKNQKQKKNKSQLFPQNQILKMQNESVDQQQQNQSIKIGSIHLKSQKEIPDQYTNFQNRIYPDTHQRKNQYNKQKINQIPSSSNISTAQGQSLDQFHQQSFKNLDQILNQRDFPLSSNQINYGSQDNSNKQRTPNKALTQKEKKFNSQSSIEQDLEQEKQTQYQKSYQQKEIQTQRDLFKHRQSNLYKHLQSYVNQQNPNLSPRKMERNLLNDIGQLYLNQNLFKLLNTPNNHIKQNFEDAIAQENEISNPRLIMDKFEVIKLYKRFFPNNNYDKVLAKVRLFNKKNYKKKKINIRLQKLTHQNVITANNLNKSKGSTLEEQKPTIASYGIFVKSKSKYPTKNN